MSPQHPDSPEVSTHTPPWTPGHQGGRTTYPSLLQNCLSLGLLSRHHGTFGAGIATPSEAELWVLSQKVNGGTDEGAHTGPQGP